MMRRISMILLTALLCTGHAFAFEETRYGNQFLLSIFFKTQALRDQALAEIRKIDDEIRKNEENIQKSEQILSLATRRTDADARKAETIAREALMKGQEARRKNQVTKMEWELKKTRADRAAATIRNMLSETYGSTRQITGLVTHGTGNVAIHRANGDETSPEDGAIVPGDKIMTGNGTAEVQMLDGRANAKLGPHTEFVMKKDTPQEQAAELLRGKVYMAVDKIDEYGRKITEKIDQYTKDLETIGRMDREDINAIKKTIINKKAKDLVLSIDVCGQFQGSTVVSPAWKASCVTAVCAVRGTKFIGEIKDNSTIEVAVLEGTVDVNIPARNRIVSVTAGNRAIITADDLLQVESIEKLDAWWER